MEGKRKLLIAIVLIAMVVSIVGIIAFYWYENTNYVTTEDSKVTGDLVKISPQTSGKLAELNIEEGQRVFENQIVGRLDALNLTDSAIELSLIRSPITGLIIKKQGNIGEIAAPGQVVAYVIDPKKLYILANIEETKLNSLKIGQQVDINVDQFGNNSFKGQISSIGEATAATFSLLPSSSSGSYTKVIQKIPVKIAITSDKAKLLPGTNSVIKIHIK